MFGESESESPRVPSPWDNLISSPPSPIPGQKPLNRAHIPSPLAAELIPRLVPEADDGNVEYKLQLLDPSPARFARLVTQMKWRLLEGGGQAYYELGVADSGDLIGLPREELEQSLETLEMMAGEIGASVIVVKEIEVPAIMATLAKRSNSGEWALGNGGRRAGSSVEDGYSTATGTETDLESDSLTSGTDVEDLSVTVVLDKSNASGMFAMDTDLEVFAVDNERLAVPNIQTRFCIDLEISSVFKPLPMRARMHNHPHYAHSTGGKNKRVKKHKHLSMLNSSGKMAPSNDGHPQVASEEANETQMTKTQQRRQGRDRRREEKRKAMEARAYQAVGPDAELSRKDTVKITVDSEADQLVAGLETLHVGLMEEPAPIDGSADTAADLLADDDDVFASPMTALPSFPKFSANSTGESHLDIDAAAIGMVGALMLDEEGEKAQPRLIVEALVVRKISLEEAFLDFGGFSLT